MTIYALTNQKGGTGKSTVALHLLAGLHERGRAAVLIDCDSSRGATAWAAEAVPQARVEAAGDADELLDVLEHLADDAVPDIVIDCAGAQTDLHRAALLHADVAALVTGPGLLDLRQVAAGMKLVQQARRVRRGQLPIVRVVLNRFRADLRLGAEALEALHKIDAPTCKATIGQRSAIALAAAAGRPVWATPGAADAAAELRAVVAELLSTEP